MNDSIASLLQPGDAEGRMRLIPCHMSELAWSLREGPLRPDVALALVSPPGEDGLCSLGVASDYIWNAVTEARVVLAEVNSQLPRVGGDTTIPFERIDGTVETDRPLPEQPSVAPSEEERVIASVERVTALRADVDMVVTEHGRASLRGITEGERAARLIAIAAPEHRDRLRRCPRDGSVAGYLVP